MDRTSENDMNQKEYQCTHCGKIGTKISRSKILLKSKRENEKKYIKAIFQNIVLQVIREQS
jgi:DNA-directed RNA polymerase subunit RPC12/RpoP